MCIIGLSLVGCDRRVYVYELDKYNEGCKESGGILLIDNWDTHCTCKDGKKIYGGYSAVSK